ncbi:hypothetical protein QP445_15710, partial [Micrococcus luteus]|nr:hypothetical protein [Micrococcus luteus]
GALSINKANNNTNSVINSAGDFFSIKRPDLPLKNGALEIMVKPAYTVITKATHACGSEMGKRLSTDNQTNPAVKAAAAGLGKP